LYRDILPEHRDEFKRYFDHIWSQQLVQKDRSNDFIQAFWTGLAVRSFIASKSNTYNKDVIKFGDHPRQKFSVYFPKIKPVRPVKVAMYVHGGMLVNGMEEVFEFLGKNFVEAGYLFVSVGFRQLMKYGYYDSLFDVDRAFKKCIEIIPQYGGDRSNMVVLTWSSGCLMALPAIYQDREFYDKHIKLIIALGAAFQLESFERRAVPSLFDHAFEARHIYESQYLEQGPPKQRIEYACGCKHLEFPFVNRQSFEWV